MLQGEMLQGEMSQGEMSFPPYDTLHFYILSSSAFHQIQKLRVAIFQVLIIMKFWAYNWNFT